MEMSPPALPPLPLPPGVSADELDRLHEHARGAAARVVDAALIRLDHLHQEPHHGAGRVELAALPALGQRELLEEVLVDAAEHIGRLRLGASHLDVAHEVDDLSEACLVQRRAGVVLRQHAIERRVVAFDGGHGLIHQPTDRGLAGLALQVRPTRLRWHPEDVVGRGTRRDPRGRRPCRAVPRSWRAPLRKRRTRT